MPRRRPTYGHYVAECFLVEVYDPEAARTLTATVERLRATTRKMRQEGTPVRYRRALLIHGDETCFHLIEAPSAEAAIETSSRAGLGLERIVEVVEVEPQPSREWRQSEESRPGWKGAQS